VARSRIAQAPEILFKRNFLERISNIIPNAAMAPMPIEGSETGLGELGGVKKPNNSKSTPPEGCPACEMVFSSNETQLGEPAEQVSVPNVVAGEQGNPLMQVSDFSRHLLLAEKRAMRLSLGSQPPALA
jgi:hypothetical protein